MRGRFTNTTPGACCCCIASMHKTSISLVPRPLVFLLMSWIELVIELSCASRPSMPLVVVQPPRRSVPPPVTAASAVGSMGAGDFMDRLLGGGAAKGIEHRPCHG